jgi:hypothetical protein
MRCELENIINVRVVTCGKFCACQLRRIQESVQIPFLSDRSQTRGWIYVGCVLTNKVGVPRWICDRYVPSQTPQSDEHLWPYD